MTEAMCSVCWAIPFTCDMMKQYRLELGADRPCGVDIT
jgi:hypothetical protein